MQLYQFQPYRFKALVHFHVVHICFGIRKQQATFFGHVMRREDLEHFLTTGELDRKRSKGRQREKMLDSLKSWLGAGRVTDMMSAA